MARRDRHYPARTPAHLVHRGVNRRAIFLDDADRRAYLTRLELLTRRHDVEIHAYVLMTNHVHLLLTPKHAGSVSNLVRDLGSWYVRRFNWRHQRSGPLWEGRHFSSLITADRGVLACSRYIELNPVRAALTHHPVLFRWSSHQANALGRPDPLLTPAPSYLALGSAREAQQASYRRLFMADALIDDECNAEADQFRDALRQNLPARPSQRPAGQQSSSGDRGVHGRRRSSRQRFTLDSGESSNERTNLSDQGARPASGACPSLPPPTDAGLVTNSTDTNLHGAGEGQH